MIIKPHKNHNYQINASYLLEEKIILYFKLFDMFYLDLDLLKYIIKLDKSQNSVFEAFKKIYPRYLVF